MHNICQQKMPSNIFWTGSYNRNLDYYKLSLISTFFSYDYLFLDSIKNGMKSHISVHLDIHSSLKKIVIPNLGI